MAASMAFGDDSLSSVPVRTPRTGTLLNVVHEGDKVDVIRVETQRCRLGAPPRRAGEHGCAVSTAPQDRRDRAAPRI